MELDFTEDPPATAKGSSGPALTAQRMKYAAEVKVFESRYGNLEDVRKNLGFSQRKMCQMLLVDPSAWTRWHSASKRPPPHIYRAIEWYLALEGRAELHPRIADLYARGAGGSASAPADQNLSLEINELCRQVRLLRRLVWLGPLVSALILAAWWWH